MNNGHAPQGGESLLETQESLERQKTPDNTRKTGVIHGVYKKLVSVG